MNQLLYIRIEKILFIIVRPRLLWFAFTCGVLPSLEAKAAIKSISLSIDCVIDVGANKGQFALASYLFLSPLCYYAFEPNPRCIKRLSKVLSLFRQYSCRDIALSESASLVQLNLTNREDSSSLLNPTKLQETSFGVHATFSRVFTRSSTLDLEFQDPPGQNILLKIDVQGLEMQVLKGGSSFLRFCSYVLVECSHLPLYSGQVLYPDVHEFLNSSNFCLISVSNKFFVDSSLLQADYLYINQNLL